MNNGPYTLPIGDQGSLTRFRFPTSLVLEPGRR